MEKVDGLENCEEITTGQFIGAVWIGHLDLSMFLCVAGNLGNPVFVGAIARIMATANDAVIVVGRLVAH